MVVGDLQATCKTTMGCRPLLCMLLYHEVDDHIQKVSGSSDWLSEGESGVCHDLSAFLSGPAAAKERSMGTEVTAALKKSA